MRPQKIRRIEYRPDWTRYLPDGRAGAAEVEVGLDMVEALRLVDAEGLSQEAAAARMDISTPTLCRLLGEARRRVATALRDGMALRCEGGPVAMRHGGHGFGPGARAGHGPHGGGLHAGPRRKRGEGPARAGEEPPMAEEWGRTTENHEPGMPKGSGARCAASAGTGDHPRPGRGRGRGCGRRRDDREDA